MIALKIPRILIVKKEHTSIPEDVVVETIK
jgi:hypothetical protein